MQLLVIDQNRAFASKKTIEQPAARGDVVQSQLLQTYLRICRQHATKTAVWTSSASLSYGDLLIAASDLAAQIKQQPDYYRGCRIVMLAPNSPEYVIGMLGIWLASAVLVPLSPQTEGAVLARIATQTQATILVTTQSVISRRRQELPKLSHTRAISVPAHVTDSETSSSTIREDELAAIFYTSGSSGHPKGVMLSHNNLLSNATSIQEYLQLNKHEKPLCVLPFQHAFGNSILQSHLLCGASLVLDGLPAFPETLLEAIAQHSCTSLSGVPDLFHVLLERSSLGQTEWSSLNYMSVAGGALQHKLAKQVRDLISPARFFVMYGQTEATARLAYVSPEELDEVREGCLGRPIPGVELQVTDDHGKVVPSGSTGELRARGPNVMLGYWQDAAATHSRLQEGWLVTGDLAVMDRAGRFIHRGRKSSFVKIAGYRVHPGDLEEYAQRTFSVQQAVAVPYEERRIGTRLALFLRVVDPDQLKIAPCLARCRQDLPRHLVPEQVIALKEYPLTASTKIDRPQLIRWAEDRSLQRGESA